MVYIQGNWIKKSFLNYPSFDHWVFNVCFHPYRRGAYICSYARCNISQRILQLSFCPHVSVTKKELCSFQILSGECFLGCHWQKCIIQRLLFSLFNSLLKFVQFLLAPKIFIASNTYFKVFYIVHVSIWVQS